MQTLSYGFSNEAKYVAKNIRRGRRHLRSSNALGGEVMNELGTVWSECRAPNWDGFGAVAVSQDTLRNMYCLVESLPAGFPVPSVGAEPDGSLTLEWHQSPRRTLSVSINETGELHYAALLGPSRHYGTEMFAGEVPERIRTLVDEVCGA